MLRALPLLGLLVLALAACGGQDDGTREAFRSADLAARNYADTLYGLCIHFPDDPECDGFDPDAYREKKVREIEGLKDCGELEAEYERVMANADPDAGEELRELSLAFADAALRGMSREDCD